MTLLIRSYWITVLMISAGTTFFGAAQVQDVSLFTPSDDESVYALGPTHFPPPTRKINHPPPPSSSEPTIVVQPTFGIHRYNVSDVILAYAEGYPLQYYMQFIETLSGTSKGAALNQTNSLQVLC
jgi:hypothetical protein